ncbi:MAG: hypothetical protein V1800_11660 [Candidatus Latescibacterota bacterium]
MAHLKMKWSLIPVGVVVMITILGGCAAQRNSASWAQRSRMLTKEDVVNMATSDIGDAVIIAQMDATGSRFGLSVSDVTELKQAGVSEKVIEYMIGTGIKSSQEGYHVRYSYYPHYPMIAYTPGMRIIYVNGSQWHYSPRRGGRSGVWIRGRR